MKDKHAASPTRFITTYPQSSEMRNIPLYPVIQDSPPLSSPIGQLLQHRLRQNVSGDITESTRHYGVHGAPFQDKLHYNMLILPEASACQHFYPSRCWESPRGFCHGWRWWSLCLIERPRREICRGERRDQSRQILSGMGLCFKWCRQRDDERCRYAESSTDTVSKAMWRENLTFKKERDLK